MVECLTLGQPSTSGRHQALESRGGAGCGGPGAGGQGTQAPGVGAVALESRRGGSPFPPLSALSPHPAPSFLFPFFLPPSPKTFVCLPCARPATGP